MKRLTVGVWILGVILPLFAVFVEAQTGLCSSNTFDPLVTPLHWLLVLCVPLANYAARVFEAEKWTDWLLGTALLSAGFYTMAMGPLLIVAGVMFAFFGFGLLPLAAPLAGLMLFRALLPRLNGEGREVRILGGMLAGLALVIAAELPGAQARALSAGDSVPGPAWIGTATALEKMCVQQTHFPGAMKTWSAEGRGVANDGDSCTALYWFTGKTAAANRGMGERGWARWDRNRGQAVTGGRLPGMLLSGSDMRVELDRAVGVEKIDWWIEFANRNESDEEARMRVALPRGGAVVGVSLWVNGVERQAAFGAAEKVREAYQKVAIVQRRDPLLVTWAGVDEVFVQGFPVPAKGTMRARLKIAAPITRKAELPRIVERNLSEMVEPKVSVDGEGEVSYGWAADPLETGMAVRLERKQSELPKRLEVVVDGSAWMARHESAIRAAMKSWRNDAEVSLWFTGQEWKFVGGADNVKALEGAVSKAREAGGTVVWLHGPQPVLGQSTISLEREIERGVPLWGVRLEEGENALWNKLSKVHSVRTAGGLKASLRDQTPVDWKWIRERAQGTRNASAPALWAQNQDPATALRFQVVTREVGAVVLERDRDYKENNLDSPEKQTSATPEPATWIGAGTGLLLIIWRSRRKAIVTSEMG